MKRNQEGDYNMAVSEKTIEELRMKLKEFTKDIPVLSNGEKGAIEIEPNNEAHRDWYEGK